MMNRIKKILKFSLILSCSFFLPLMGASLECPWSKKQNENITHQINQSVKNNSNSYKIYEYPISEPDQVLKDLNQEKILIFAYGSLLNIESAKRSLGPETMQTYKKAIAFGLQRVFDRHVPETKRWGLPQRSNDIAALNVHPTGNWSDSVNGVILEVDLEDFKALLDREEGYDLIPIPIVLWDDAMNSDAKSPDVKIAYTFRASEEPREGKVYTNPFVNPIYGYALASKEGAAQHGTEFLDYWVNSTFLADRKTSFSAWEKNPKINCGKEGCS